MEPAALLKVDDLQKYYPVRAGLLRRKVADVKAVDGVGFEIRWGETLGLVGESGCGKTTLVRAIARLVKPTHGRVRLRTDAVPGHADEEGMVELGSLPAKHMKSIRRQMQVVFQDPDSPAYASSRYSRNHWSSTGWGAGNRTGIGSKNFCRWWAWIAVP